jgi:hypothetical protein
VQAVSVHLSATKRIQEIAAVKNFRWQHTLVFRASPPDKHYFHADLLPRQSDKHKPVYAATQATGTPSAVPTILRTTFLSMRSSRVKIYGRWIETHKIFRLWAGFAVTAFPFIDRYDLGHELAPPGEGIPSPAPACGSYFPKRRWFQKEEPGTERTLRAIMAKAVLATTSPNSFTGILTSAWGKLVSAGQLSLDIFSAVESTRTVLPRSCEPLSLNFYRTTGPFGRGQKLFSFQPILNEGRVGFCS